MKRISSDAYYHLVQASFTYTQHFAYQENCYGFLRQIIEHFFILVNI